VLNIFQFAIPSKKKRNKLNWLILKAISINNKNYYLYLITNLGGLIMKILITAVYAMLITSSAWAIEGFDGYKKPSASDELRPLHTK